MRTMRWRAEVNKHFARGQRKWSTRRPFTKPFRMMDMSCGGHAPVLGALYHAPGAIARHDAVAWGYGRGADQRGVEIHQNTEVLGIETEDTGSGPRVKAVVTSRGRIETRKVLCAVAGSTPRHARRWWAALADLHPSAAGDGDRSRSSRGSIRSSCRARLHVYVSQSARGELVMGASLDPYELHFDALDTRFRRASGGSHARSVPVALAEVKVKRQWAGMADMTPDFAPMLGKTPVAGLLSRCRLGNVGLQGHAGLRQDDELHRRARRSASAHRGLPLRSLRALRADGREGRGVGGALMKIMTCPVNGPRPGQRVRVRAANCARCRIRRAASDAEWADYVFSRNGVSGHESASGGATRRAASGSSPCATPCTTWSCGPICSGRTERRHERDSRPVPGEWIDRTLAARVLVRRPALTGFAGRHDFVGAGG